ncbi:MAG TPA: hypothetical protein VGC56_14300 [Allosphingosinicella sp.]
MPRLLPPPLLTLSLLAMAAVACKPHEPDWARQARQGPLPAQVCKEIEKGVEQIRASRGIDLNDTGEATMATALWNQMPPEQHDQLLHTLAFHAACKAGTQSDAQPVVVHGDDGGELARRAISTRVDTSEVLRD